MRLSWVNFKCRGVLQFGWWYICRARVYCACSRCGWGLFGHFYSPLSFLLSSLSLSLGDGPIKTEILSQRAAKPKKKSIKIFVKNLPVSNQSELTVICRISGVGNELRKTVSDIWFCWNLKPLRLIQGFLVFL